MLYLLSIIRFIILISNTLVLLIIGSLLKLFVRNKQAFSNKVVEWWGKSTLFILGIKVELSGKKPEMPSIIMANHRSYIDIFVYSAFTPGSFIAKGELRKWPILGQASWLAETILVDRNNMQSLMETMRMIQTRVKQNYPVLIFAEGTTYIGPLTKKFKPGAFKIAAEAQTPVTPSAISFVQKNDAWVDDDLFIPHFLRQFRKPITIVNLWYGEPIISDNQKWLLEETKNQIDAELIKLENLKTKLQGLNADK